MPELPARRPTRPLLKKALVIGRGSIGRALVGELKKAGCGNILSMDRSGIYSKNKKVSDPRLSPSVLKQLDCAFLAIPSSGDGRAAFDFIKDLTTRGIPVVTCEKAALGHRFKALRPFLPLLGFNASVGGGIGILSYLRARNPKKLRELHAVLNGTLNFIASRLREGASLPRACSEAVKNGYAEPGADDPLSIIKAETRDILLKSVILFNAAELSNKTLSAADIPLRALDKKSLRRLRKDFVFIVSLCRAAPPAGALSCFQARAGNWRLVGAFQKSRARWLPQGVNNAFLIREESGNFCLQGPGAGPLPTAAAMLADARALLTAKMR